MADRTVKVKLTLDNKGFLAGLAAADKAARHFQDTLGKSYEPFERETQKQQTKAPREAEKLAGNFARAFSKRLEAAFKSLPKANIDATSTDAQIKLDQLRRSMEDLSGKTIGVDINASSALGELRAIQAELAELGTSAEIDVRADAGSALAQLQVIQREIDKLGGETATVGVDADTAEAQAKLGVVGAEVAALNGKTATVHAKADVSGALKSIGMLTLAVSTTAAIPVGAVLGGQLLALAGPLSAAGLGFAAFGAVALPAISRVNEAIEKGPKGLAKLTAAERALADEFMAFTDSYNDWQKVVSPDVWPIITGGLNLTKQLLPQLNPLIKASSGALAELEARGKAALAGPHWAEFLATTTQYAPRAITGLGTVFSNVFGGIGGVIQALMPHTDALIGGLERATQKWEDWGRGLKTNQDFIDFIAFVKANAPEVWEMIKNVAVAIIDIVKALAPLGMGSLQGLSLLAQLVSGMDPAHIQAIAVAIIAVKLAQAGFKVAGFWTELTTKIGGLGDAADKAKGKLGALLKGGGIAALAVAAAAGISALGDELQGLNPDLNKLSQGMTEFARSGKAVPELLDQLDRPVPFLLGLKALDLGQWENFGQSASRLVNDDVFSKIANGFYSVTKSVSMGLVDLDSGAQRISNLDQGLQQMVSAGNGAEAAKVFDELAKRAAASGISVDELAKQFPGYAAAVAAAVPSTGGVGASIQTMGGAALTSAGQIRDLGVAISEMASQAFAAEGASIRYEAALDGATEAARRNGETTDITTAKGRENRTALKELAEAANGVRVSMEEMGAPMLEVSAKAASQRQAFIETATSMGLSKKAAADLATAYGLLPGSVTTKIYAETANAQGVIDRFIRLNNGRVIQIGVDVRSDLQEFGARRPTATGAIDRYAAGGIKRFAAGGMSRPRPPQVVDKPTVLFGEGSSGKGATEAFIPYESRYRDRAIDLLGQVASDFGLEVYNRQAARRVDNLGATLNETQHSLVGGMASATSMLAQTLGSAGSLTSSINNVGVVGEAMTAGWIEGSTALGDSVGNMSEVMSGSVAGLTASVQDLAGVIGESASWSAERMSSTNSDTYEDPRRGRQRSDSPRSMGGRRPGGSQGSIIPPKPKPKPGGSQGAIIGPRPDLPPPGVRMPNGDFIAFKAGGIIDRPTYALMGEAGREAVVPLDDRKRGRAVLGQAAQMLGVPNRSKVSRPQQMRSYVMAAPQGGAGSSPGSSSSSSAAGKSGALVNVESLQVREHADIDRIGAALYSRLGDKGP